MNSFKNVEKAINFEIERQINLVEDGGRIIQETLLWNADKNFAASMRSKEEAHDYRYFPDPDLVPVVLTDNDISTLKSTLPLLAEERKKLLIEKYNLPEYDSSVLTSEKPLADYFEETAKLCNDYKSISNWIMGDISKYLNENKISISEFNLSPENLGILINLVAKNTINNKIAKDILTELIEKNVNPEIIVKEKNLVQISDSSALDGIIDKVLQSNSTEVEKYLSGKESVIGFLVGQIMRESKGKANPQMVNSALKQKLDSMKG